MMKKIPYTTKRYGEAKRTFSTLLKAITEIQKLITQNIQNLKISVKYGCVCVRGVVFTHVSEKTTENSDQLGRQALLIEPVHLVYQF